MPIFNIYATIIVSRLFLYFIHERDEKFHNNKNKLFRKSTNTNIQIRIVEKSVKVMVFGFSFRLSKNFGVKLL